MGFVVIARVARTILLCLIDMVFLLGGLKKPYAAKVGSAVFVRKSTPKKRDRGLA
jgi:hypothetical protein